MTFLSIHLISYFTLFAGTLTLAFWEYTKKIKELNTLNSQLLKLQEEHSNILLKISKQESEINNIVTNSSITNESFYTLLGLGLVIVLIVGCVYVYSTPNTDVSEIVAQEMPTIADISSNAILRGIENATVPLGNKLHLMDCNLEKLSETAILIGVKCAEMESKIAELLVTINGENIPAHIIADVAQNGIFM